MDDKIKMRNSVFEFANKYLNEFSSNPNSTIYFSISDVKVPTTDLKKDTVDIDFIGKIAKKDIYFNFLNHSWEKPESIGGQRDLCVCTDKI